MKRLMAILLLLVLVSPVYAFEDKVSVQVIFKETVNVKGQPMEYCDALYFKPEDYFSKTHDEIKALKQARVDNWVSVITDHMVERELTKEELEAEKVGIDEQMTNLLARKDEIENKLAAIK